MDYRMEWDSMGEMEVPADRYWGAQTQRSYQNFQIGTERMPEEIVRAFGILKKAAALANHRLGKLDDERLGLISRACDEVVAGKLDGHFPLVVWQTGSGTQSNMNVNEVVANRGNELAGKKLLHPNDHVNMSQSSNDTFPTAMHIAAAVALEDKLLPAIDGLVETFRRLEGENGDVVKSGADPPAGRGAHYPGPGDQRLADQPGEGQGDGGAGAARPAGAGPGWDRRGHRAQRPQRL